MCYHGAPKFGHPEISVVRMLWFLSVPLCAPGIRALSLGPEVSGFYCSVFPTGCNAAHICVLYHIGRVLNRFSKDVGFMDDLLPYIFCEFALVI